MDAKSIILTLVITAIGCSTGRPVEESIADPGNTVIERITTENEFFNEIILLADTSIENGTFNKMVLKKDGAKIFEIHDQDNYDTIETKAIEIKNEVSSRFLLLQKLDESYYISLFGAQYGCCARQLTILRVDDTGITKLFKDEFEVHRVSATNSGEIQYFGINSYSEPMYPVDSLDVLLFTYNPTLVYRLNKDFRLDSLTTRRYNEESYVFAGFTYDAEVKVAFPKDGEERRLGTRKPFIYP